MRDDETTIFRQLCFAIFMTLFMLYTLRVVSDDRKPQPPEPTTPAGIVIDTTRQGDGK